MPPAAGSRASLSIPRKSVYALGDLTVNTAISALSLVYASYFLTQVAGLRGFLAGLIPLIARFVDAITDPLMGRISDRTTWASGRRRPYFLIGAIPFGLCFAGLWWSVPTDSQALKFVYYTVVYTGLSLSMTVLSVPYLALIPEMALGYDERTSLNAFRNAGSTVGIFLALTIRPLAEGPMARIAGGPTEGFLLTGLVMGAVLAAPWLFVHRVSFEREGFQVESEPEPLLAGVRSALSHANFRQLIGLYLFGRIAMDLIGALLILYFAYWIGRTDDFELMLGLTLASVIVWLPLWQWIATRVDKATAFRFGCLWWAACQTLLYLIEPGHPRVLAFVMAPLLGFGFAVVDLMPWAMVGEVVDEDELRTGERREGLYNGLFMFLRKLAGAIGVFVVLTTLDLLGFTQGEDQSESVVDAIRAMAAFGPALCLLISVWWARGYPLTREAHERIRRELEARARAAP